MVVNKSIIGVHPIWIRPISSWWFHGSTLPRCLLNQGAFLLWGGCWDVHGEKGTITNMSFAVRMLTCHSPCTLWIFVDFYLLFDWCVWLGYQWTQQVGFMRDPRRANVMLTRGGPNSASKRRPWVAGCSTVGYEPRCQKMNNHLRRASNESLDAHSDLIGCTPTYG